MSIPISVIEFFDDFGEDVYVNYARDVPDTFVMFFDYVALLVGWNAGLYV